MATARLVYLLIGSNLQKPLLQLTKAKKLISIYLAKIISYSSIYKSAPWGNSDQPSFLNQVIVIKSSRSPEKILSIIKNIEIQMGRLFISHWGPRIIDIDILFYGNEIIQTKKLVVPHLEIQNRRFVLIPLLEITNRLHPVLNKKISELLDICPDSLSVNKYR